MELPTQLQGRQRCLHEGLFDSDYASNNDYVALVLGCSLLQTLWGPRAGPEARSRAKRRGTCLRAFAVRRRATPTASSRYVAGPFMSSSVSEPGHCEPGRRDLLLHA